MSGAGAVAGLVLLEWSVGWVAAAAWTQSWQVIRRGHFRIIAWGVVLSSALALVVLWSDTAGDATRVLLIAFLVCSGLYALAQYVRTDLPGVILGVLGTASGIGALVVAAADIDGWPLALAALGLVAGAALLGAVTNGMLLGHWYLNQPGLKPWALARLTLGTLVSIAAVAVAGAVGATRLMDAPTEGAILGLPGFGRSFGGVFFAAWVLLIFFTAAIVWMARRCVSIRSIQSATGLFYVAVLTAGVSEFVVRYLMVQAT